jgi:hypothetical protein
MVELLDRQVGDEYQIKIDHLHKVSFRVLQSSQSINPFDLQILLLGFQLEEIHAITLFHVEQFLHIVFDFEE